MHHPRLIYTLFKCAFIAVLLQIASAEALQSTPSQLPPLQLATWNMEWLVALEDYPKLLANCDSHGQPSSDEWRFPCDPEHTPPPKRTASDIAQLANIATNLIGSVVALQEVDGPIAAAQVFPADTWKLACFTHRKHPQAAAIGGVRQVKPPAALA